ncbi:MAG: hypothetical protein JSU94_07700 [Phycisphaerales bacterium]|nr:MAG: hypothetical protein JSU94_07700 [Phycisphaerales bacterium]
MEYRGRYGIFDAGRISTYLLSSRTNKVTLEDLVQPGDVQSQPIDVQRETAEHVERIAAAMSAAREAGRPAVFFTGAHLIKNGLGPLLIDLVERGMVSLVAGNFATAIHDFELALIGQTSEYVPDALGKGQFGMAYEFACINAAISLGDLNCLGLGESLGRTICDENFRMEALGSVAKGDCPIEFLHPEASVLAACYEKGIPLTVHAGIGTDVTDQHASFDGRAKGGCSARDFLIYTNEIAKLTSGGVVVNMGSAVTGPEVLLKAVSMAANTGAVPRGILTADFDLRQRASCRPDDESAPGYYFRDQKSVVKRIPEAFDGKGLYVQGDQKQTFVLLYRKIIEKLGF